MAFTGSDHIAISRAGTLYKTTGSDILAYVNANIGTSQYQVADIAARNALVSGMSLGDRVFVTDATADATVNAGWAIYVYMGSSTWTKVAEQEGLDVIAGGASLTYTAGASSGIVVSDSGTDATIPAVDGSNAGLMLPAHKSKLDNITISGGVNLDTLASASHAAATTVGSSATNPVTLSGQQIGFSIANLTSAP
jgi:hypothetical protein